MFRNQFFGVPQTAANIGRLTGNYTDEMFREDFPQFFAPGTETEIGRSHLPETILAEFIQQANASIQPDKWLDGWRYAAGLYIAHYATLYLRTFAESTPSAAQAAASGALVGVVKSATLGDSSVSYDTSALTSATEAWGDLNATQYGQMLASRARLAGMGGTIVW